MSSIVYAALSKEKVTPEDFLLWVDEDDKAELIDGEVFVMSPAAYRHQKLEMFLSAVLNLYVKQHRLGLVADSQYMMRFGKNYFVPDIIFVQEAHRARCTPTYVDGPADLVMEILSPSTAEHDQDVKFKDYARNGVSEYWIVNPVEESIAVFHLTADDEYERVEVGADGAVRSVEVAGFYLRPEWVWTDDGEPDEFAALRALGVMS
ncbi:MAG: Uma2 family endonuclease [Chloroflexota bacterium]